jgi:Mut7-C RNAse domain
VPSSVKICVSMDGDHEATTRPDTASLGMTDEPRFLCDEMLVGLGRWLRIAGYDTAIAERRRRDRDLVEQAIAERSRRIVISSNRRTPSDAFW